MPDNRVKVIMYHYVRPIKGSQHPGIRGLELCDFAGQLNFLQKHYHPITMEQLISAIHYGEKLPEKAILLTFDDGYSDHYQYVLPVLLERKLQGSFYPSAKAIAEHKMLDVNKIHFILACAPSISVLLKEISHQLAFYRREYNLPSDEFLFNKLAVASPIDTKEVIFFKRLLQVELPLQVRVLITGNLFRKFVCTSEEDFSSDFYLSLPQLQEMSRLGMHIGCHGYSHQWLETLPADEQREDIEKSLLFLEQTGADMANWTMSYPFGSFNPNLVSIINEKNCRLAFISTNSGSRQFSRENRFELPRIDTVDLPFSGD